MGPVNVTGGKDEEGKVVKANALHLLPTEGQNRESWTWWRPG